MPTHGVHTGLTQPHSVPTREHFYAYFSNTKIKYYITSLFLFTSIYHISLSCNLAKHQLPMRATLRTETVLFHIISIPHLFVGVPVLNTRLYGHTGENSVIQHPICFSLSCKALRVSIMLINFSECKYYCLVSAIK